MKESACRACGSNNLQLILSLGKTPLANALLTADQLGEEEETYPLDVIFCNNCTLVQITETVPAEKLFKQYFYFSSFSDTMLKHSREVAEQIIADKGLKANSFVVEIASNDGYLLQNYIQHGIPVLGIEPAKNIAELAQQKGIPTLSEFFDEAVARRLASEGKFADVIHANNVLAHVAALNSVICGIERLLKPTGTAIIEVHYVRKLIENTQFDVIYHEHLCYYSLTALDNLFKSHGLTIQRAEQIDIHGGSLRIYAGKDPSERDFSVGRLLQEEHDLGMDAPGYYEAFGARITQLKSDLLSLLHQLKDQGKHIAVYGASAKGSTLLNYYGIGAPMIDFVADRSTAKQGHYTPGTHLPIVAPEKILESMPDYVLLLTWNFADEILAQQAEYRRRGGKFIIPIPEVRIV